MNFIKKQCLLLCLLIISSTLPSLLGMKNSKEDALLNKLCMAIADEDLERVRYLIDPRLVNQPTLCRSTLLNLACMSQNMEIVQLLIEKGADVNQHDQCDEKNTPLTIACEHANIEIVKLLINNKADINAAAQDGYTPLLMACWYGHTPIAQLLIDHGADINHAAQDGYNALMLACLYGYSAIVRLLVNKGAQINYADRRGHTVLTRACYGDPKSMRPSECDIETLQLLILHGAKVNTIDLSYTANPEYHNYGVIAYLHSCQKYFNNRTKIEKTIQNDKVVPNYFELGLLAQDLPEIKETLYLSDNNHDKMPKNISDLKKIMQRLGLQESYRELTIAEWHLKNNIQYGRRYLSLSLPDTNEKFKNNLLLMRRHGKFCPDINFKFASK